MNAKGKEKEGRRGGGDRGCRRAIVGEKEREGEGKEGRGAEGGRWKNRKINEFPIKDEDSRFSLWDSLGFFTEFFLIDDSRFSSSFTAIFRWHEYS